MVLTLISRMLITIPPVAINLPTGLWSVSGCITLEYLVPPETPENERNYVYSTDIGTSTGTASVAKWQHGRMVCLLSLE